MNIQKAGYGKIMITPPLGLELCGFGYYLERKATAVRADLYAIALYFETDHAAGHILINCDLIGFRQDILRQVRQSLVGRLALKEENIMLTATHTHTGPATYDVIGCGEVDESYVATLPHLLVSAAVAAYADAKKITGFTAFDTEIDPIGFNRTPGGIFVDSHVRGFRLQREGEADLALINYGCHPVSYSASTEVSPDYPGRVVERLAAEGTAAVFINGPCGDIDPLIRRVRFHSLAEIDVIIDEYASRITDAYIKIMNLQDEQDKIPGQGRALVSAQATMQPNEFRAFEPPCWVKLYFDVDIPLQVIDEDKMSQTVIDTEKADGIGSPSATVVRLWQNHWHGNFQNIAADPAAGWLNATGSDKPYTERASIHVMLLETILLVGVPYEIFTRLRTLISEAFPGKTVLVAGNTDTTLGYLASQDAMTHSYEALSSSYLYHRLPPAVGALELLAEEIIRRIKEQISQPAR